MNARSNAAALWIAVSFSLCGLVSVAWAIDSDGPRLPDEACRAILGGAPAPAPNGLCLKNNIQCSGWDCYQEESGYCTKCVPHPYSKCITSNNAADYCNDNWGINGHDYYCGDRWYVYSDNGCNIDSCIYLESEQSCNDEIPTSVSRGTVTCHSGE